MFGEIESLVNSGSFNDQVHSIGPTLFFHPSKQPAAEAASPDHDDEDAGKFDLSVNVGVQFGLTDATSDTALKFQGSLSF